MSRDLAACAPVLVLGLGNPLLADDGVGPELCALLEREHGDDARVEFVDGGTQGLALLGFLDGREAVLVLDAVALGATPGSVHHLADALSLRQPRGEGAHEGNAGELFAAAMLLGSLPPRVVLVGIEPAPLRTRIGFSDAVNAALPYALEVSRRALDQLLIDALAETEVPSCTS